MTYKFLDKNDKEIKEGMLIKDDEGVYEVLMYDFFGLGKEYCISSKNSIWCLDSFLTEHIDICVEKLLDFEIVEQGD